MLFLLLSKVGTAQGLDYCHEASNKPTYTALNFTTYEAKYTWMELIKVSYLFLLWFINCSSHGLVLLYIILAYISPIHNI